MLRIYNYLPDVVIDDDETPPTHIDYRLATTLRLEPVQTREHGVITQIDYLGERRELVVRESYDYTRENNFASSRRLLIEWYRDDDTPHEITKTRVKHYAKDESIKELENVRRNIVTWMRAVMSGSLLEQPARKLLEDLSAEIQDYLLTGSVRLKGAILMYDFPKSYREAHPDALHWLDFDLEALPNSGVTYRLYIASEVEYGETR